MNVIEENCKIYEMFEANIKKDDFNWYGFMHHFKCVNCGRYVTRFSFLHFKKDPAKVLCYECAVSKAQALAL